MRYRYFVDFRQEKTTGNSRVRWLIHKGDVTQDDSQKTIFSATQRCNVETMLQALKTMSQRCVVLKLVVANRLTFTRRLFPFLTLHQDLDFFYPKS